MSLDDVADLRAKIRDIKDFPTEGILFKDITTLLKDPRAFRYVLDQLANAYIQSRVEVVVVLLDANAPDTLAGAIETYVDQIEDLLLTDGSFLRLADKVTGDPIIEGVSELAEETDYPTDGQRYFARASELGSKPKFAEWHREGFRRLRAQVLGRPLGGAAMPRTDHLS